MNIVETVTKLHRSLTKDQSEMLYEVVQECKKLGATSKQLAPLFAAIMINCDIELSEDEIKYAQKLAAEDKAAGRYQFKKTGEPTEGEVKDGMVQ